MPRRPSTAGGPRGAPIAVTLAKSGQVKSIALSWIAKCGSGQRYTFGSVITAAKKPPSFMPAGQNFLFAKVSKKGRVSGTALGADNIGNGRGAAIAQKVTGKIKKTSASGTWSATVNVLDSSGNKV